MSYAETAHVFVASPGDVPTERRYVDERVAELNRSLAPSKGLVLQTVSWEGHARPGFGKDAQALINEQIGEMSRYALFIGIMWNRLGTPTARSESGTVEEFERAVAAHSQCSRPEIWFYFRDSPAMLETGEQLEQRKKVLEFRKRIGARGLPWTYKNPRDFRDKFGSHLTAWLSARPGLPSIVQLPIADEPSIRVDRFSLQVEGAIDGERSLQSVCISLTNVGRGLARDIEVFVWVFMVTELKFRVPKDEDLPPQFIAHLTALMAGESAQVHALRSLKALQAGLIPPFVPDAVPVIKVTVKFRDDAKREFVSRDARAGSPEGHFVAGYDHEAPE